MTLKNLILVFVLSLTVGIGIVILAPRGSHALDNKGGTESGPACAKCKGDVTCEGVTGSGAAECDFSSGKCAHSGWCWVSPCYPRICD